MLKLSIIIPVFNVENYVSKCLESCIEQNLSIEEYEIVVVDDGSPDKSIQKVNELIAEQQAKEGTSNIKIVTRENGGLSAARNTGLKEAKGEYVWFVDSDDWIETNVLRSITDKALKDNLDVLCFNLQLAFPDGKKEKYKVYFEENGKVYEGTDFICKVNLPPAAWIAIYKREYLKKNNLNFYEGILHEDMEFTPRAYCLAQRIAFTDDIIYNYYQRDGSIMKSKQNEKRSKDFLIIADSLYLFINQYLKNNKDAYNEVLNRISFVFSQSLAYNVSKQICLETYQNKPYYPLSINQKLSRRERLKYRLINTSLRLYLKIYKLK